MALVHIETWLEEKLTCTLKRKKQHIKKSGMEKINYDAVERSQSESKKFDTIDVGLYPWPTLLLLADKNIITSVVLINEFLILILIFLGHVGFNFGIVC